MKLTTICEMPSQPEDMEQVLANARGEVDVRIKNGLCQRLRLYVDGVRWMYTSRHCVPRRS